MQIVLENELGNTIEKSFSHDDMEGAADFCMENPDYEAITFPEGGEDEWDDKVWQSVLDRRAP